MKIIAIILSGIVYLLILIPLTSIIWTYPFSSGSTIIQVAAGINCFFAGIFAGNTTEKFYKWFISKLK